MTNPYQAPAASDGAPSSTQLIAEPPPDAEYEIEPADAVIAVRAQHGYGGYWIVGIVASVVLNVINRTFKISPALLLFVVAAAFYQLLPWLGARAIRAMSPAQRRLRISFAVEAVTVADGTGRSTRVGWSQVKRRMVRDRVILEAKTGANFTVPRRAFASEADFLRAQSYIAARTKEVKRLLSARTAIIMWIVLLAMFVAIWSFFSDVPRDRPPATQGSTPQ